MTKNRTRVKIDNIYVYLIAKGLKLKQLREKKGISITELHEYSGLSRTSIYKMENGNGIYTVDCEIIYRETLKKLA